MKTYLEPTTDDLLRTIADLEKKYRQLQQYNAAQKTVIGQLTAERDELRRQLQEAISGRLLQVMGEQR